MKWVRRKGIDAEGEGTRVTLVNEKVHGSLNEKGTAFHSSLNESQQTRLCLGCSFVHGLGVCSLLGILRVWVRKILCFVQTRDLLTWPRGVSGPFTRRQAFF